PDGYLFLCSPSEFQTSPTTLRWPKCTAYWSLDPCGSNPLSIEEASSRGFPSINLATEVHLSSWDETVYDGLRKFHAGKGFDP
ncbi:hypothetical protein C8R45DRAFT_834784, partial [Mycena sanguinolenta]